MAGLFIVAGMVMVDRHRQKKQAREAKVIYDDNRYHVLQEETRERLSQRPVSMSVNTPITTAASNRASRNARASVYGDESSPIYSDVSSPVYSNAPSPLSSNAPSPIYNESPRTMFGNTPSTSALNSLPSPPSHVPVARQSSIPELQEADFGADERIAAQKQSRRSSWLGPRSWREKKDRRASRLSFIG